MEYKLSQIAQITGGILIGEDRLVTSVFTDSRNQYIADSLFVAISGVNHNGHDYIEEMVKRGAQNFLVEKIPEQIFVKIFGQTPVLIFTSPPEQADPSFVLVPDTLRAIQALARYHRLQYRGEVIAITGSNGKTVVKEWFAQLWHPANGKLLRSPRSYNSQIGVALSLLMIEGTERLVFIEAGISKVGEMERLESMICPTLGVITNIGDAHLRNFASAEELKREKMKLFTNVRQIIPGDKTIPNIEDRNLELVLRIYDVLGLDHRPIEELQPVAMRLELKEGVHGSTIINDGYVNDLVSLGIALDYQSRLQNPHKILIFSDFAGPYEAVADLVAKHGVELFVGVGHEILRYEKLFAPNSIFYADTAKFMEQFDTKLIAESSVLLKGSRPFAFEQISYLLEKQTHTTVLEIDLDAMAANLNHYKALIPRECRTMAMVKAHSYGSGSVEVAAMLQHQGVDYLAVAFADEGVKLRVAGIHTPIVVLNSDPNSFRAMIEHDLEPEIYSFSSLNGFISTVNRLGVSRYPIHVKLDTGMRRLGFVEDEIEILNQILSQQDSVAVTSVFSHLAAADDPSEDDFTRNQIAKFTVMANGLPPAIRHICNTAGIRRFPDASFDMVRLGLGLYTGKEVVGRLKTKIVQIKKVEASDTVGYNRRGKVAETTRIATLPIGYADGLNRHLSCGVGLVSIGGILCPIIGNVCMDTCMIDLTNAPDAKEGDEVVIFGDNPTVSDLASWLDTIPYEILTSISARIKRIYING